MEIKFYRPHSDRDPCSAGRVPSRGWTAGVGVYLEFWVFLYQFKSLGRKQKSQASVSHLVNERAQKKRTFPYEVDIISG